MRVTRIFGIHTEREPMSALTYHILLQHNFKFVCMSITNVNDLTRYTGWYKMSYPLNKPSDRIKFHCLFPPNKHMRCESKIRRVAGTSEKGINGDFPCVIFSFFCLCLLLQKEQSQ